MDRGGVRSGGGEVRANPPSWQHTPSSRARRRRDRGRLPLHPGLISAFRAGRAARTRLRAPTRSFDFVAESACCRDLCLSVPPLTRRTLALLQRGSQVWATWLPMRNAYRADCAAVALAAPVSRAEAAGPLHAHIHTLSRRFAAPQSRPHPPLPGGARQNRSAPREASSRPGAACAAHRQGFELQTRPAPALGKAAGRHDERGRPLQAKQLNGTASTPEGSGYNHNSDLCHLLYPLLHLHRRLRTGRRAFSLVAVIRLLGMLVEQ